MIGRVCESAPICYNTGMMAKELEAELRKEGQANSSSRTSGQLAMEYVVGGNFMFHGQHVLVS